jgi:hypothetical protein
VWKRLNGETSRRIFAPDSGSLLDIWVFGTTSNDWQLLLNYLSAEYVSVYSEDGNITSSPRAEVILRRRNEASVTLEVMLCGFTVNCHFFETGRIEMNLLPEDVNTPDKVEAVFELVTAIATLLNKEVFLVPEFGGASNEKLRELAVCVVDPRDYSIRSRLDML